MVATFPGLPTGRGRATLRTSTARCGPYEREGGTMAERVLPFAGHALRITETNTAAYVAVCECGWSGMTHPTARAGRLPGSPVVRNQPKALAAALRDHSAHITDERTRARAMLAPNVVAMLRRPGRFSTH